MTEITLATSQISQKVRKIITSLLITGIIDFLENIYFLPG